MLSSSSCVRYVDPVRQIYTRSIEPSYFENLFCLFCSRPRALRTAYKSPTLSQLDLETLYFQIELVGVK